MIQYNYNIATKTITADIKDAINDSIKPLIQFKSQQTNKSLFFLPLFVVTTKIDRFCQLVFFNTTLGVEDLLNGYITMGTTDLPYGFYDVTIYKNVTNTNLNPNANNVQPVYYTLMNLFDSTKSPSTFTEYTTNDTNTNSVYITY